MCADSRTDSLAARLKRLDLFDEYFGWCFAQRPSFADRLEWLDQHACSTTAGALSRLHRSPEASVWRTAEAAKARKVMDKTLPKDIDQTIRKALLDARFSEVMGELSHKELMDHLQVENDTAALALKVRAQKLKETVEPKKLKIAERRVKLLEDQVQKAKDALTQVASKKGISKDTRKIIEDAMAGMTT
jgi:hypothetical protein